MRHTTRLFGRTIVIFCAFLLFYSFVYRSLVDSSEEVVLSNYIPPFWQDACQFLELPVTGLEGQFISEKFRIRGVSITFRHGARSSLYEFPKDFECLPYREKDRRDFAQYQQLLKSEDFEYFLRLDPQYKQNYSILPEKTLCSTGQLTAEGALQHLKLGKFMRERYIKSNIFREDIELNVTVTTSLFNRTFQSGVAFSTGFFYPLKYRIPQLYIKATPHTSLCSSIKCVCNRTWDYYIRPFSSAAPRELVLKTLQFVDKFEADADPRPLVRILDTTLTRHICKRKPLPCQQNGCISYDFLREAWNYTSYESSQWNYDKKNFENHKMNVVSAYGVLFHTHHQILHMRAFPHTNMIKVFSGHDSTIAPLMHAMRIPFLDFPRFAARLTIEIFDNKSDTNKLFIRILFNGEDVTGQASFCKDRLVDELCPADALEDFVTKEIPSILGAKTFQDACH